MTGPLAPLFAQVGDTLTYWGERAVASNGTTHGRDRIRQEFDSALAALSAIERHTQDMERERDSLKAVMRELAPALEQVGGWLQNPEGVYVDDVLDALNEVCEKSRAALSASGTQTAANAGRNRVAREKGTERGCAACDGDPEAHGRHVCGKGDYE